MTDTSPRHRDTGTDPTDERAAGAPVADPEQAVSSLDAPGNGHRPDAEDGAERAPHEATQLRIVGADTMNGHDHPADDLDSPDVRRLSRLSRLRPVPPITRLPATLAPSPPQRSRPVPDPSSARRRAAPEWLVTHVATLVLGDTLVAAVAVLLAHAAPGPGPAPDGVVAVTFVLAWPLLQLLSGSYTERHLRTGGDESRRVVSTGVLAVALCGVAATLIGTPALGRLVVVGAPAGTLLSLVVHGLIRWRLHRARRGSLKTRQAVLVGRDAAVLDLARRIRRDPCAGLEVVGACVPRPQDAVELRRHGIAVLGRLEEAVHVLDAARVDVAVVTSASETAGSYLRKLARQLEGTDIELLVSPGIIEVATHRLRFRPSTSLPLIQVREPHVRGCRRGVKGVLDRIAALVLLVVCAPVLLGITIAIRMTSPGPALDRHRRVGERGRHFDLLKFRSTTVDADRRFDALSVLDEGDAVQLTMHRDPRVTPVGRILRRYSLDELPQLINVLKGEMSFVGPRPHVDREVEQYGSDMRRRLLVKPGVIGLWQVSGRADLSWDEGVERDVRYVENWSLGLDLSILWRTVRAVLWYRGAS